MESSPVIHAPRAGEASRFGLPRRSRAALLAAGLVLIAAGSWWIATRSARERRTVEALLAEAYSRQRTFEFRLPALTYASVLVQRGDRAAFARPVSLLEAESLIARRLAGDPDNAEWLRLRARAEMLDRNFDDAVSTLKRAADAQPDDASLLADLGVAYALRAEGERREIDYGAAIDTLWRFLRARPDSPLALFNRAVVYERMFLYDDARKDWERYLQLDPAGGWAAEARVRKQVIERRMEAREQALKSLASASGYLQAVKEGRAYDPEFYLWPAVTDWLPAAVRDPGARAAVATLARLLRERHGDSWLEDLLRAKPDARYRDATTHLAAAAKYNLADDAEAALEEARQAQRIYREAGVRSGELRAKYEEVYALFRALEGKKCLPVAGQLVQEATRLGYGWIRSEALMESGNCRGITGDRGGERVDFELALSAARANGYKTLELRGLGLLGGNAMFLGNQLAVWQQVANRLSMYWQAPYPGNRGHQFYHDLSSASTALDYRFSAFVFRRASATEISRTPNQEVEAYAHAVAAGLAGSAGLTGEAEQEFNRAGELFARCRQTASSQLKRFGVEVTRAEFEVERNAEAALRQLERISPGGGRFSTLDTEVVFFQAEGRAKLTLGDLTGAEAAFRQAIQRNEQELASLPARADRSGLLRKSGDAYRGPVYLSLSRKPNEAFKQWEWYRAADLPGSRRGLDLVAPVASLASEILISYVTFPDGTLNAWVLADGKMEARRLPVKSEDLESVATRFVRQCADPRSPLRSLRRDGRRLYDWLIAPVGGRLGPGHVLVIEPDGPIGAIPMQALIDPDGKYLGERFPIVVSHGLASYAERSQMSPLTSRSVALVIANPALGSDLAKAFPPLEDAAREARDVEALFPAATFLSGKASTLEALESFRSDAEIFHFAGHSVSAGSDVGLLLATADESGIDGRMLRGSQILGQDWSRCTLAVLSACSTGTGERNGFVNPVSLVRAFLNAGTGRVVASRWNVDTTATAGFMRRFYQSVLSGTLPSAGLQDAAEALRKNPATAHPYYWAAFQLFGYK
jgi:CHAT domain-containing protein/Flp pilus assembly protein TadD